MIDALIFNKNSDYMFDEQTHTYFYKGEKVNTSVTAFIGKYFEPFDTEGISARYAKKHGLLQEDVKKDWEDKGRVSALAGTMIHSYLENSNRNKLLREDYIPAEEAGLKGRVEERYKILLPKAQHFANDIKGKLIPLAMEYTVGFDKYLAGNIDLLAWNEKDQEIQIWDYKNTKEIATENKYQKMYFPFEDYDDCNFIHYSLQLSFYKAMAENMLGIKIGKMYLVHFDYMDNSANYTIYRAQDFSALCANELNKLVNNSLQ